MLERIERAITTFGMLENTDDVTVALSGGADSVSLLHAMLRLKEKYGFKLYAAHLNHCLRGEESDGDEAFVRELCKKWGIPLFCERADVSSASEANKESVELAARNIRYEFLNRVAKGKIATAHNADDNAETVIFNMVRGSALQGICGIPPVRENIIRPLIFCSRTDIEKYCEDNGLSFRTDSTNADVKYSRNRIRHSVMPELKKLNGASVANISRMTVALRRDCEYLDGEAERIYNALASKNGLPVDKLINLPEAILYRVILFHAKQKFGISPDNFHLQAAVKLLKCGNKVQISGDIYASVTGKMFDFICLSDHTSVFCDLGNDPASMNYDGVDFSYTSSGLKKINNLVFKNSFDCDKIKGNVIIRNRLEGDSIRLAGRKNKSLKKLFCENHIPLDIRPSLLVLADDEGVFWVQGFGVDERAKVTSDSQRYITVTITDKD